MCQAVSVVSGLYPGPSPATHSPQPVTPSTSASTKTIRRSSVRIVLVSNGAISFILNSRSLISRIRILDGFLSPLIRFSNGDLEIAPRRQQVLGALLSCPQGDRGISACEPIRELLAHARLHRPHPRRLFLLPLLEFRGQRNLRGSARWAWH